MGGFETNEIYMDIIRRVLVGSKSSNYPLKSLKKSQKSIKSPQRTHNEEPIKTNKTQLGPRLGFDPTPARSAFSSKEKHPQHRPQLVFAKDSRHARAASWLVADSGECQGVQSDDCRESLAPIKG